MKKIFALFMTFTICLMILTLGVGATEVDETVTETETLAEAATEIVTETEVIIETEVETADPKEVGEMIDTIIGGVKDGALTAKDAILMISEIAGMTKTEAEELINKAISAGDAYLQDTGWWAGARVKVMENLEFFTVCLIVLVDVLAIVGGAVLLIIKIKRPINNIDYGTAQVAKDSTENKLAISQTLENLKADITSALNIEETSRAEMLDREAKHAVIEEQLLKALQENAELKRGMLNTQAFILQILKLIYSRTDLTLADKSVLDLWTATSEVILGEQMSEEDALKLEEMKTILKGENSDA